MRLYRKLQTKKIYPQNLFAKQHEKLTLTNCSRTTRSAQVALTWKKCFLVYAVSSERKRSSATWQGSWGTVERKEGVVCGPSPLWKEESSCTPDFSSSRAWSIWKGVVCVFMFHCFFFGRERIVPQDILTSLQSYFNDL